MPKRATEAKSNAAAPAPAPEKEADVPSSKATSAAPAPVPRSQTKPKPAPADEMHLSAERGDVGRLAELLAPLHEGVVVPSAKALAVSFLDAMSSGSAPDKTVRGFGAVVQALDKERFVHATIVRRLLEKYDEKFAPRRQSIEHLTSKIAGFSSRPGGGRRSLACLAPTFLADLAMDHPHTHPWVVGFNRI